MRDTADIKVPGLTLDLGMAAQTKVDVALGQQLGINRSVRVVAGGTALSQGGMFEDERPRLLAMTRRATFVEARHRQSSSGF